MKNKIFSVSIILFLISTLPDSAQNLNTVLLNYEKKNNISKRKELLSVQYSGIRNIDRDYSFNVIINNKRQYRCATIIDGKEYIELFDGANGWIINPFSNNNAKQKLESTSLDYIQMSELSDLEGLLINHEQKGITINYLGITEIEDKNFFTLKIITRDENLIYYYIGTNDFLIWQKDYFVAHPDSFVKVVVHEYIKEDGLYFPVVIETIKDGKILNNIIIDEIKLNTDYDESKFSM